MKTIIRTTLSILVLSTAAHASTLGLTPAAVPEIDPSLATTGLVLLTGAVAVLRGRKRA